MDSYDRVMMALSHSNPDRLPLDFTATPEVKDKLMQYLKLNDYESLLQYFGVDFRHFAPRYIGPKKYTETNFMNADNIDTDYFGISWKKVKNNFSKYYEIAYHPLKNMKTIEEIEKYNWPNPDWFDSKFIYEEVKKINKNDRKVIVLYAGGVFEIAWYMRGLEQYLIDLAVNPNIAELISRKLMNFFKERTTRAINILGGIIDIIYSDGDIGTQNGMMISPDLWRKYIKPLSIELIKPFKEMGFKTMYHSCGSIIPVIKDFIEMGLDILDPIQTRALDMDPYSLKRNFGHRLSFHGGIDEQKLLPYGNTQEVKDEVEKLVNTLGKKGGYILSSSHAIQSDTPLENILTMYKTAREYKY